MKQKKHTPHSPKKNATTKESSAFPTMFFESISANEPASKHDSHTKPHHTNTAKSRTERLVWMWSGVTIVMIVVFFAWIGHINASGVLNFRSLFQKNDLIKESRQSLKYYFEKQNQDRQEMSALANSLVPTPSANNPVLGADQVSQLKNKITTLSASASSSAPVALPSSLNKK